jgi:hypothetical protein
MLPVTQAAGPATDAAGPVAAAPEAAGDDAAGDEAGEAGEAAAVAAADGAADVAAAVGDGVDPLLVHAAANKAAVMASAPTRLADGVIKGGSSDGAATCRFLRRNDVPPRGWQPAVNVR